MPPDEKEGRPGVYTETADQKGSHLLATTTACHIASEADASPSRDRRKSHNQQYRKLLGLSEFGKSLSDDRRLIRCGCKISRGEVGRPDEALRTTTYCNRAWLCPICGYRAARDQARKLTKMLTAWRFRGGSLATLTLTLTLTQAHTNKDELDILWGRLEDGWAALVRGSAWRADKELFGLRGYIRITEVVHRLDNGWHVHFHVPLLVDKPLDAQALGDLKDRAAGRFMRGIRFAGGQASWSCQDLRSIQQGSERRLALYWSKGTMFRPSATSRSPMTILSDLNETGEGLDLWKEFSLAVTGAKRKRYSPSSGIENLVRNQPWRLSR